MAAGSIAAADPNAKVTCRYRDDTLILETDFETPDGAVTLIDFMPVGGEASHVARIVIGRRGQLAMRCELVLRFDYGSIVPWVTRLEDGTLEAVAGPDMAVLRTPIALRGEHLKTVGDFTISEGQTLPFVLTYGRSYRAAPEPIDPITALGDTEAFWRNWSAGCTVMGEWSGLVRRSLITLKALTYQPTGGIVAAPTTSLPEQLGGTRNWDYRYCWLRDASLTLLSLMHGGSYEEARDWRLWLHRAVAGLPAQAQIMYGIAGERRLTEIELPWLPGYEGSAPVRIGNAASDQFQLDIYGEILDAYYQGRRGGLARVEGSASDLLLVILDHVAETWREPDEGIWEVRGPRRHFTHSKVMAWVAADRAIKLAQSFGLEGPVEKWKALRRQIHDDVCAKAFNAERGAFVQYYGANTLDASVLLMPLVGFLPITDPACERHGGSHRAQPHGPGLRSALRHRKSGRWAASGGRRVSGLQLLACRLPSDARPRRRRAQAFRKTDRPVQRCRAFGRGIRPANGTLHRQFSAGFLAHRACQYGSQSCSCR